MAGLIRRAQIWTADLEPGRGAEIRKRRPVLIIANNEISHNLRTTIVIPISSQISGGLEKVFLPKESSGLREDSVILPILIRAIDKTRLIKKVGKISQDKLEEVEDVLKLVLGMIEI